MFEKESMDLSGSREFHKTQRFTDKKNVSSFRKSTENGAFLVINQNLVRSTPFIRLTSYDFEIARMHTKNHEKSYLFKYERSSEASLLLLVEGRGSRDTFRGDRLK